MNKLMPIGLIAVLSGTGTAAWAQAPTPRPEPTQQTAPKANPSTLPRSDTQRQGESATQRPGDSASQRSGESANQRSGDSANQSAAATAASKDAMTRQHAALQAADTNRDGLVSKPEYMAYYESEYGKVKKDSAGMISLKDLAASATPIASSR